jgi:hypothetical protein
MSAAAENSELRRGVRALLTGAFQKVLGVDADAKLVRLVADLEVACIDAAGACEGFEFRVAYARIYGGILRALPAGFGACREAPLAAHLFDGRVSPAAAADPRVFDDHTIVDPRRTLRTLFFQTLARDPRFDSPGDARRADFSVRIERGCFNATIARCAVSADSYRRHWDSDMFVNLYSEQCGRVSLNIDPAGAVVSSVDGGAWALDRLASGAWSPESLGTMSAAELCPPAGEALRNEVRTRLSQKVEEKTSTMFACPDCHKRNATYRSVQIGSGDEPSTFMCKCIECGRNFEGK